MAKKVLRKKMARGKTWYRILSPKIFNENEIGETLSNDPQSLIGRIIKTHLSEISGDITKHNVKLQLKVNNVIGENAHTEIIAYELSKPYLQRIIRRRITKMDIVNDVSFKDGKKFRVKTVAITLNKAASSKAAALRHEIYKEIEDMVSAYDFSTLVLALSTGKLQREIQKKVSKIYPVRFLDIRKIEMLKEKKEIGPVKKKEKTVVPEAEEPAQKNEKKPKKEHKIEKEPEIVLEEQKEPVEN